MKLKYIFWDNDTGYGVSAKQIIQALIASGIQILSAGLKHTPGQAEYTLPDTNEDHDYDLVIIHSAPYYIERLLEKDKINIAYCTWETTVLPAMWVKVLNRCDAIFVPSTFNKKCYETSGVGKPIIVLPHISEFAGRFDQDLDSTAERRNPFTFYTVGMWTNRKNNFALMQAFHQAFAPNAAVRLVIKTSDKDYSKPASYLLRKLGFSSFHKVLDHRKVRKLLKQDPRIEIHTETWTTTAMADFHHRGDCFISLCRSEGWGMGAYEAAWFGKPVIITNFGGHCDFLMADDAYLLPYRLTNIKETVWTEYNIDRQQWAEIDLEDAIQAMRSVYDHQDEAKAKGIQSKQYVKDHFDSKRIIETFIQDLELLHAR